VGSPKSWGARFFRAKPHYRGSQADPRKSRGEVGQAFQPDCNTEGTNASGSKSPKYEEVRLESLICKCRFCAPNYANAGDRMPLCDSQFSRRVLGSAPRWLFSSPRTRRSWTDRIDIISIMIETCAFLRWAGDNGELALKPSQKVPKSARKCRSFCVPFGDRRPSSDGAQSPAGP
jgi:hypothetical protein